MVGRGRRFVVIRMSGSRSRYKIARLGCSSATVEGFLLDQRWKESAANIDLDLLVDAGELCRQINHADPCAQTGGKASTRCLGDFLAILQHRVMRAGRGSFPQHPEGHEPR